MHGKIALEECWSLPAGLSSFDPFTLAPKGVIGDDLVANLTDIHATRLQQMDENGIELMALSLVAAGAQGIADPAAAEKLARTANDVLGEEVTKNPGRFAAFVAVSMHDAKQAGEEVRRCWEEKAGFIGVMLNDFQSSGPDGNEILFYDQKEYDDFWRVCDELGVPVYIHPRSASPLIYEQMWAGRPHLAYSALGYANRVNMHLLGIITAGVLDRFPRVKLIVGHMGEHVPYDLYRIDHKLNRARFPQMGMRKDKLVRDYFGEQVFITTSGHFSTPALQCAMTEVGTRSVMFSVDYPFESTPNGCAWWDEVVERTVNGRDVVDMGRNNALNVFPRLKESPHGLKAKTPSECQVGGLRGEGRAGVEYGLYNVDWSRREIKTIQS